MDSGAEIRSCLECVCLFVLKHKLCLNNKGIALQRAEHLQLTFHSAGAINAKQL